MVSEKFSKRLLVVEESHEKYPKKIAVEFANDRIKMLDGLRVGDDVLVEYYIESREYNNNWYTTARGLAVSLKEQRKPQPAQTQTKEQTYDLPF